MARMERLFTMRRMEVIMVRGCPDMRGRDA